MIELANITLQYGKMKVLDHLNLKVKAGEIAAIMGKSGSGKTSLLLCLVGFVHPGGRVIVDGRNITSLLLEERQLAYVPQSYGLFPHLSVEENIGFGLLVRKVPAQEIRSKVLELLHAVDLPRRMASRNVHTLSGGEQQRVALARALAIEPKAFLLDEPLSAIDVETKKRVGKELRHLIKKLQIPAIIITHNPQDAAMVADSAYILENGRLTRKFLGKG